VARDPAPAAGLRLTPSKSSRLPVDEKGMIAVAQDNVSATGHVAKVLARPVRLTAIAGAPRGCCVVSSRSFYVDSTLLKSILPLWIRDFFRLLPFPFPLPCPSPAPQAAGDENRARPVHVGTRR
jgi:hypothetical protein